MNGVLWRREPEIVDLIRYFDQPSRRGRWDLVTEKESRVILKELDRCRQDFSYAARNYFWIVDKTGEDIPFRLWESQELILEKWYWMREKFPNKAQKMMILKARQLGASTVIEGLIAWSTIFFSNRNAIVVSHNDAHAAYLFGIMLHIYDHLPWWLRPMCSSRKRETGLELSNPVITERPDNPGNNSIISVQSASQLSGVGQGMKVTSCHCSEYADWQWDKFAEIIDGDLVHAIADNINSFAFLESTGKGSGSPSEEMWVAQVELAEEAEWLPVFLPWFFEKTRVIAPESGWRPEQPECDMRERVKRDWTRCDNPSCQQYFESNFRKVNRVSTLCSECEAGVLQPVVLGDAQLRFMHNRRLNALKKGPESFKKLKEELACTAEEAFQLSGIQVFPEVAQEFVNFCVDKNPLVWGNIDDKGRLHYVVNPSEDDPSKMGQCACEGCTQDHRWDEEHPLQLWDLPEDGAQYSLGVDVSEGLGGKSDYSVIFINRVSPNGRNPDVHVGLWRSNTIDPIAFASPINALGRMYNNALVSIEVNKYDSCFNAVRLQYLYPNLFVWKHYDSKNPISQKLGWVTNLRSKPMLWQTAVRWLRARQWIVRSDVFMQEMKKFQKDAYDDQVASAERNFHDDVLMAGMIALFCAHDLDYSEESDYIPVQRVSQGGTIRPAAWLNTCLSCSKSWETEDSPARKCPRCRSMLTNGHRQDESGHRRQFDIAELGKTREELSNESGETLRSEFDPPEDSFATY